MDKKLANRVSVITIIVNLLLSLLKFIVGFIGKSQALVSDAVHSASDVVSTIAVMFGVNMSAKQSDTDHPYGHERIESIFSIILAMMLFVTGIGIGISAVKIIISGADIEIPSKITLAAAAVSIAVKEWMYHYTKRTAKKINSSAMLADAWHHRSDALSSVGAFIGILGARMGVPVLDPLASVVICIFIVKAAYDIFKDAVDKMVDKSCDEEVEQKMRQVILGQNGVQNVDLLRTRLFGAKIYVDIEISADGNLTLREGHEIAQKVHDQIEKEFPLVKHCMVHVNPI